MHATVDSRRVAGHRVTELIDQDDRSVSALLFSDPAIYERELEQIFDRSWLMVAHVSELPAPHHFVQRYMGQDQVLVTRDGAGDIHVLLNSCSHKGTQVCSVDTGRSTTFVCPYHGWVYRSDGGLAAVLAEQDAYGDKLDKSTLGLKQARVATYAGFVFATWNHEGPSLTEHLGEYAWYLDIVFGAHPLGMEVLGEPIRWTIECNWKLPAGDNFVGDAYHVLSAHRVAVEIGLSPMGANADYTRLHGTNVTDGARGHGLRCTPVLAGDATLEAICAVVGIPAGEVGAVREQLSDEQLELFVRNPPRVGTCFPNFSWLSSPFPTVIGGPLEPMVSVRLLQPKGPTTLELWTWPMAFRCATDEVKEVARRSAIRTFNSSGIFEQDDAEIWTLIQRSFRGVRGRHQRLLYRATAPARTSGWAGPLEARTGLACEDNMWAFYEAWLARMVAA